MNAVILAGGFGKRLSSVSGRLPKPLVEVAGESVLSRQLSQLRKSKIDDVILSLGYMSECFDGIGGVRRFVEEEPLGTGGALFGMKAMLDNDFFVINGDLVFDVDLQKMLAFHKANNALATVFAHPNRHPFDSTLLKADSSGKITALISTGDDKYSFNNLAGAGIYLFSKEIFSVLPDRKKANLDRDVVEPLLKTGRVFAYRSPEYVKDMGTPERLRSVNADVAAGIPKRLSAHGSRRAVFLDRDGTINVYKFLITDHRQIELLPGAAQAVAAINDSGYLAILASNQPGIAKGLNSFEEMDYINGRLEALLGKMGACLDGIYYCPHHPEVGHRGEIPSLKINCDCRKPKPGLLLKAAEDFGVDLSQSYMVGDNPIDCEAGVAAGCKPAFLTCGKSFESLPNFPCYSDLFDFVNENIISRR